MLLPTMHCMRGSRNFRQGGSRSVCQKKAPAMCFFFSPQLILQKSNGQFQRNLSFFKVPEGVQHFPGGSNFFQGESNCLFPIETHITCDFPGEVWTPCPPSGSAIAFQQNKWTLTVFCNIPLVFIQKLVPVHAEKSYHILNFLLQAYMFQTIVLQW